MTTWKTTTISAVVHQAGDNPIINECSTTITICDEAAGAAEIVSEWADELNNEEAK